MTGDKSTFSTVLVNKIIIRILINFYGIKWRMKVQGRSKMETMNPLKANCIRSSKLLVVCPD